MEYLITKCKTEENQCLRLKATFNNNPKILKLSIRE